MAQGKCSGFERDQPTASRRRATAWKERRTVTQSLRMTLPGPHASV